MDPKAGELFSIELKSEETLMEGLSDTAVQYVHINRE